MVPHSLPDAVEDGRPDPLDQENGPPAPLEGEGPIVLAPGREGSLTRRDGEVIVDTLFDAVIGALKSGDKIEIRGFGSFRTRQRNARTGRNPKTGAKVDVPAKRVPFFKPSKELRDSVNPNGAAKSSPKKSETADVDPHHPPAM